MKTSLIFSPLALIVLALMLLIGCGGGGGGVLKVGDITGPATMQENTQAQFSITASGDTGIKYQWAIDPLSSGTFNTQTGSQVTFSAAEVDDDLDADLVVTVTSDNSDPVVKHHSIQITNGLLVGNIVGPDEIDEGVPADFSVTASGDTGITYLWEVDPTSSGHFSDSDAASTTFTSGALSADLDVTISVEVDSDNFDPVTKTADLTIINFPGTPIDPSEPDPFQDLEGKIMDIAVEGDGDVAFATSSGLVLFSAFGVYDRLVDSSVATGLYAFDDSWDDYGAGFIAVGPGINDGRPTAFFDMEPTVVGFPYYSYNAGWWGGEPDPYYDETCVANAASSSFTLPDKIPTGIAWHPLTGDIYQRVFAPDCIADSDCDWPVTNVVDGGGSGAAILAYNAMAPLPPDYMSMIFEGGEDFAVYYDGPYYLAMTNIAGSNGVVPACVESPQVIKWNPLNPFAFTSDRNGMTADSVGDFVFDPFGRMIMAVTESDAVVITDPVVFGDPMVIQLTLGGRQNGEGVLPGEFTRPTAVALSPVTGNLFVSDTGNGRIQVFNHDGNFIREFGGDDDTLIPGALAVDAFGSVLVANLAPDEDPLRIYNENGTPVSYGALEGHVYSAAGGDPIHYAYVSVENFTTIASVITDINGYFYMPGMPEGTHKIKISASGYADLSETVEVEAGYITQADFELE